MEAKTKWDRYILEQVQPILNAGEVVSSCAALTEERATGAWLAALTNQRLILIATRVAAFRPLMENRGMFDLPRASLKGVCFAGVVMIELADGGVLTYMGNPSTRHVSTQRQFFDELRAIGPSHALMKSARSQTKVRYASLVAGVAVAGLMLAMLVL